MTAGMALLETIAASMEESMASAVDRGSKHVEHRSKHGPAVDRGSMHGDVCVFLGGCYSCERK